MLERARAGARQAGFEHVRFDKDLLLNDGSVDVVISNGIINLAPDKRAAFGELYASCGRAGGFSSPTSSSSVSYLRTSARTSACAQDISA
jgi:hypothetical protein